MKLALIGITLAFLADAALADPVRMRILDGVQVSRKADEWHAVIDFQVPVRVLRHVPLDEGQELLIFVELLAVSPDDVGPALQRESLRIPPGASSFLRSVVFDGAEADGPRVEIHFASPQRFDLETGGDLRSISLTAHRAKTSHSVVPPQPAAQATRTESSATRLAQRMEKARRAIARGELPLAISYLTGIAAAPEGPYSREALELLGVAREKNGQLAHAKAEYQAYLGRYPEGEDADRVRQRLRAMLTARAIPKPQRKPGRFFAFERGVDADLAGSVSFTYDRAARLAQEVGPAEEVVRSALYSDVYLTARLGTRDHTLRGRFSGRLGEDLLGGREIRVSSLFGEFVDRPHGFEAILGRQSRSSGGILGRFDGGHLALDLPYGMRAYATAGFVVDSSRDFDWSPDRHFYGVSLDLPPVREKLATQLYVVRQMAAGITDRFAIGSEMRYVGSTGFAALFLDFDLHFGELNTAYLVANWRPRERLQINFLANHRTSPILLTRSALSGQAVQDLGALLERYDEDQLRQIARDRTARTTSLSLGGTYRLSDRFQLASDFSATRSSGTRSSADVAGFETTGWELVPSMQLIASDLVTTGDLAVATLRLRHEPDAETLTASLLTRVPVGAFRIGPTVRVDRRVSRDAPDLLVVRPLIRFDLRFWSFVADAELGFEWRRRTIDTGADDLTYHLTVGLRRNF